MRRAIAVAVFLVLSAGVAQALVTMSQREEFGPPKAAETIRIEATTKKKADKGATGTDILERLRALSDVPERRYWSTKRFDGWGHSRTEDRVACQGDVEAANRAMAQFATLAVTSKEIRLFPAPGVIRSFDGSKPVPCAWHIDWVSNYTYDRRGSSEPRDGGKPESTQTAVLTVFIARAGVIPTADPRIPTWIGELDDVRFAVRQEAFRRLADQQEAALPVLERALAAEDVSLEKKKRLEQLLERLQPIHLARLKVPSGVKVLDLNALVEQAAKDWRSGDLGKSYYASEHIAAWSEHTDAAFPLLVEALADDREQVRDSAVKAFEHAGTRAAAVLPALRDATVPAKNWVHLRKAVQAVEQRRDAKDSWDENRRLRQEIAAFCKRSK